MIIDKVIKERKIMASDISKEDKIYQAIRRVYGYTNEGDDLVDFLFDLMEDHERIEKGAWHYT